MKRIPIDAGFIPLVDAAPLIVAYEMGFAGEEGIDLRLRKAPSWSTLRDMLVFGQIQAAHMLSPLPVASALGLLRGLPRLNALMVTSLNGTVIGLSSDVAETLKQAGFGFDFTDAVAAGEAIKSLPRPLRIGVPFLMSMHTELVTLWLASLGMTETTDYSIHAIPPQIMAQAVGNDELDLFCVGEPWGSVVVDNAQGALLLPGSAIWSAAPEKVLATSQDWADENPETTNRLMRAVWRASKWLSKPDSATMTAEILRQSQYLNVSAEILDRSLKGRLTINAQGDTRTVPNFIEFHNDAATFPWKSQAAWIGERLAERYHVDGNGAPGTQTVFRSDLYRQALGPIGANLPAASLKVEGALNAPSEVEAIDGSMILGANHFFDGSIYDPDQEK